MATDSWNEMIRKAVKASGLSLYAVAKRSGLAYPPVERFAKGEHGLTVDSAEKIGAVVGVALRVKARRKAVK